MGYICMTVLWFIDWCIYLRYVSCMCDECIYDSYVKWILLNKVSPQAYILNENLDNFTYSQSIVEDDGYSKQVKSRIAKKWTFFWEKIWKISPQTTIRILKVTIMIKMQYILEMWMLWKTEEDMQNAFQRNCLKVVWGTRLNNYKSNKKPHQKCYIPLFRPILK